MALLWCDAFDGYGDKNNDDIEPSDVLSWKYYVRSYSSYTHTLDEGRFLNGCIRISTLHPGQYWELRPPDLTNNSTLIAGVAFKIYTSSLGRYSQQWPLLTFWDGTTKCLSLVLGANAYPLVIDGNENILGLGRVNIERGTWHYYEMKAYCHETEGTVEVRINSCPVIKLENINTKIGSNNYFTRGGIGGDEEIQSVRWSNLDDFYVCDGSGNVNNDFLEAPTVAHLFPDGDDSVNFATTGNGDYETHFEQVNTRHAHPDTDYIEDDNTGNRDIFTYDNLTSNFTNIYGAIGWTASESINSSVTYKMVCSSNGTEELSANITPSSGNQTNKFILEENPDTSNAWTLPTINAMKFGLEIQ